MLYGTAIAKESNASALQDIISVKPSNIMNAIDALNRYASTCLGEKTNELRLLYAILLDYSHPTISGIRHLFEAKEIKKDGWEITYCDDLQKNVSEDEVDHIIKILLISMKLGHSAAIMVRLGQIEETSTCVVYRKPSSSDGDFVWQHILQGRNEH